MTSNTKGVVISARNNNSIEYSDLVCIAAKYVRKSLSGFDEICLITDTATYESNTNMIDSVFDLVIIRDPQVKPNPRMFKDTVGTTKISNFLNMDRASMYDLSPYDETLVIDADYFVMTDVLDQVWGSENDFMINCKYHDISGRGNTNIHYLDDFTIPMYWATVMYFKKSDYAESVFYLVNKIQDNYQYYYQLYNCSGTMFRNDYAFSIALHILNGNVASNVPSLPIEYLNNSYDLDDIYRVDAYDDILMFCATRENKEDHVLGRFKNMDLHIMNKFAIMRHKDAFLEAVNE